jgi:hypothetical protein
MRREKGINPPLLLSNRCGQGGREEPFYYFETRVYVYHQCVCVICLPIRDLCARRSKKEKRETFAFVVPARLLARCV